jgi:hypothetical protein
MGRIRFEEIWRSLYFSNAADEHPPGSDRFDKIFKVRKLVDICNNSFSVVWKLGDKVAVDEAMIAFKGRTYLRQYLPKKIVKWGFKLWMMACSSSGFCARLMVEEGLRPGEKSREHYGETVTKELTKDCREGTTIFADRFFCSPQLAIDVVKRKMHIVGTTQKNRTGFPKEVVFPSKPKKKDRPPGYVAPERGAILSAVNARYGLRAVTWIDNQHVSMIASRGDIKKTVKANRKGKDKRGKKYALDVKCPEIIHMYVRTLFFFQLFL